MSKKIPDLVDKFNIFGDFITAGSRTRTGTDVTPRDFKSLASANFAMPAQLLKERAGLLPSPTTLKGLEPSTSAVTGRRTNQLYHRARYFLKLPCLPPGG